MNFPVSVEILLALIAVIVGLCLAAIRSGSDRDRALSFGGLVTIVLLIGGWALVSFFSRR